MSRVVVLDGRVMGVLDKDILVVARICVKFHKTAVVLVKDSVWSWETVAQRKLSYRTFQGEVELDCIAVRKLLLVPVETIAVVCCAALCIRLRGILRNWFLTSVLSLLTHVPQPHKRLQWFFAMIQEQYFLAFQLLAQEEKHFYQKNTRKSSQMWKWFETWSTSGKEFVLKRIAAAYIARTIPFIYSPLQSCVRLFTQIVTSSCNYFRYQRFVREKFSKNEISEKISQK